MLLHALSFVLAMTGQVAPPAVVTPAPLVQQPAPVPPKIYNETADVKALLATALKGASDDDIRVLINCGANDDPRSAVFSKALQGASRARPAGAPARPTGWSFFGDEYKVVNVDVGHLDKNQDVATTYGMKLAGDALPALAILDKGGKVVARARARDFASADDASVVDVDKLAAFLTTHEAPTPDANAPLQAALKRAKRDGKSVMVWFSAPW